MLLQLLRRIRLRILVLAIVAAACSAPPPGPALPSGRIAPAGELHTLQIDLAGCYGMEATYDGELWHMAPAGIRCALTLEVGHQVVEWAVYGRHDAPTKQVTTAVLQRLDTVLTQAATRHTDVGERQSSAAATAGEFAIRGPLDPPWPVGPDGVYSLLIVGIGTGDRVGAATVVTVRP